MWSLLTPTLMQYVPSVLALPTHLCSVCVCKNPCAVPSPTHPIYPCTPRNPHMCKCVCMGVLLQTSEFGLQFSTVGWKQYLTALKAIGLASLLSSRIERP